MVASMYSGKPDVMETTPTATRQYTRLTTLLGFIAMILIWGSFPVAVKIGVQHAPPLLFSGVRFLLAFLIMAVVAWTQREQLWLTRKQHLQILFMSLLMVGIPSSIFFAATPYAPVGVLTLMWATTPIYTALFNLRGVGEVRGWRLMVSLMIGFIGILTVLLGHIPFWPGTTDSAFAFASSGSALTAELAVLASAVIYGFGIGLAKRSSPEVSTTVLTAWQVFYSGAFILAMSLIFEHGYLLQPTWTTFTALLYLVVFCSCISFFLTFWLIRRIGAIRTAYADFIIPGVTLILSYLLLGESLTPTKVGGFVLVMVGCALIGN
jgi:drug/metabolite transporter (DMT)-like permease